MKEIFARFRPLIVVRRFLAVLVAWLSWCLGLLVGCRSDFVVFVFWKYLSTLLARAGASRIIMDLFHGYCVIDSLRVLSLVFAGLLLIDVFSLFTKTATRLR